MPKHSNKRSRPRKPRRGSRKSHKGIPRGPNPNNPSLGQGGRPTLVIKTHQMLDASITTSTSFVKQINITPYLGVLPTALEQSKFYQQYRISKVAYTIMCLQSTNTAQTAGTTATPFVYSVALRNTSIPAASELAYLTYKNLRVTKLDRVIKGSFVPYVQST